MSCSTHRICLKSVVIGESSDVISMTDTSCRRGTPTSPLAYRLQRQNCLSLEPSQRVRNLPIAASWRAVQQTAYTHGQR